MEHLWKINRFLIILFLAGVLFGILFSLLPPKDQIGSLEEYLSGYFTDFMRDRVGTETASLFSILFHEGKWILIFFLLGISVLGSPLLLFLIFIKGVIFGFTLSTLLLLFKEKGALFFLFSVLPQNLLLIPVFILMGGMGLSVSLYVFQNRILTARGTLKSVLLPYLYFTLLFFLLSAFIGWYEKTFAFTLMERSLNLIGF